MKNMEAYPLPADQAIEACGGDPRETVKALLIAIDFLEAEANELLAAVSKGYSRGRHGAQRERKGDCDGRHLPRGIAVRHGGRRGGGR
ncbi:hypothetical protein [Bradyrhizobium sp. Arg816]|uniref:hypothetical protein n=1 Tax=Bradyrhizobium sp. Arg816 TaxID=2998491 RepID=UPI00249DBBCE|nr:hypothetical protein [Bradyrhizobium sp. Arg816]